MKKSHLNAKQEIRELATKFAANLKQRIDNRVREMEEDDKSHFLIYQVFRFASLANISNQCRR